MTDLVDEAAGADTPALMMEMAARCVAEATVRAARDQLVRTLGAGSSVLDLLAGEFGWQIAQIFADDSASYLTAPDGRRHVWHCCLAAPERSAWTELMSISRLCVAGCWRPRAGS